MEKFDEKIDFYRILAGFTMISAEIRVFHIFTSKMAKIVFL